MSNIDRLGAKPRKYRFENGLLVANGQQESTCSKQMLQKERLPLNVGTFEAPPFCSDLIVTYLVLSTVADREFKDVIREEWVVGTACYNHL